MRRAPTRARAWDALRSGSPLATLRARPRRSERRRPSCSRCVKNPLFLDAWKQLVNATALSTEATISVAAAWFPSESMFLAKAGSYRGDELPERLAQSRLAYVLEPALETAMHLGRALAEAGRPDEVRAVAATRLESPEESKRLESYLLAFVALHSAKLEEAIPRLEPPGTSG